jgi:mycofactocin system creatininase family protein
MRIRLPAWPYRSVVNAVRSATQLSDLTWPEIAERARSGVFLAIPVGSTEQHGPHLPMSTDTDIAVALCERLARSRPDVLVAPAVAYGSSGEHAGFAGTLSIGQEALRSLLVELVRSATETFDRVLLISAHGGNADPVARAAQQLRAESRDVLVFSPRWQGDPHAGRPETAMQLALGPQRVQLDRAVVGDTRPLAEILPLLRRGGVRAVSESGVLGDPTEASVAEGEALLARITDDLLGEVGLWIEPDLR